MPRGSYRPKAGCHPEKPHYAKGLCKQCWRRKYQAQKDRDYNRRSYVVARKAEHRRKPESQARLFVWGTGTDYDEVLRWFLIPAQDRICHMCGELVSGRCGLDHNHETKEIRGWAHNDCNITEGKLIRLGREYWRRIGKLHGWDAVNEIDAR